MYVFEIKESITDISTVLRCLNDLENPSQLPIQQVLGGASDWVLIPPKPEILAWIFEVTQT